MVAFWSEYEEKNIEERLYEELNPQKHAEIGIIIKENTLSSKLRYMIGVIAINKHTSLPLVSYKIAGGKYAIITTPPVDMTENEDSFANIIKKIWKYIFIQWFSEIDYEYDETRNDFEYYDERCHYSKDAVMDIYIPIK